MLIQKGAFIGMGSLLNEQQSRRGRLLVRERLLEEGR